MKTDNRKVSATKIKTPEYDFQEGCIVFKTTTNRVVARKITPEVEHMLRGEYMYECDMQALHRWLFHEQDDLSRGSSRSMIRRAFKVSNALKQHLSGVVRPVPHIFYDMRKNDDFLVYAKPIFMRKHPDVDEKRYIKAQKDYDVYRKSLKELGFTS